jgi:hypothetical protein
MFIDVDSSTRVAAMRTGTLSLTLLAAVALMVAAVPAASAKPISCKRLQGKVVVDKGPIKIVKQRERSSDFRGYVFKGCVRGGRVRNLGSAGSHLSDGFAFASRTLRFTQARGEYLLRHETYGSETLQAQSSEVLNVRTGKHYLVYSTDSESSQEPKPFCGVAPPVRGLLDAQGRFAGVYPGSDNGQTVRTVEAFTATGAHKALDKAPEADIAPASLTMTDGTVSWVNAGTPKSVAVTEDTPGNLPDNC